MQRYLKSSVRQKLSLMIGTIVVAWAILEPFDLHEIIFPNWGLWRYGAVLVIAIGVAFLPSALNAIGGIRVSQSREKLHGRMFRLLDTAKTRVCIVTIAGRSIIKRHGFERRVRQAIDRGVEHRILVLDPSSPLVAQREELEDGVETGRIRVRIRGTLTAWKKVHDLLPATLQDRLMVRLHSSGPLSNAMWFIDNVIFFVPYLYGTLGENCPVLTVHANRRGVALFARLEENFENLWADAQPVEWAAIADAKHYDNNLDSEKLAKNIKSVSYFAPCNGGQVMLVVRKRAPRKGYFGFLGGHAHAGESVIQAMRREVQEEVLTKPCDLNPLVVRAIGPDNTAIKDTYFDKVEKLEPIVRGFAIDELELESTNVEAVLIPGKTIYYLFSGQLTGPPSPSQEVERFEWREPHDWIAAARNGGVKIQPVDLLLLRYLVEKG